MFSVSSGGLSNNGRQYSPRASRSASAPINLAVRLLMNRLGFSAIALALAVTADAAREAQPHRYTPKEGFVPTDVVAIEIAVAVWKPIYGAAAIAKQRPFTAKLANGVWTVEGSLPAGHVGGTAIAEIAKADGQILRVSHGR